MGNITENNNRYSKYILLRRQTIFHHDNVIELMPHPNFTDRSRHHHVPPCPVTAGVEAEVSLDIEFEDRGMLSGLASAMVAR